MSLKVSENGNKSTTITELSKKYNLYMESIVLKGCDNINRVNFTAITEKITDMKQLISNIINNSNVSVEDLINIDSIHNNIMSILSKHCNSLIDFDSRLSSDIIMQKIESEFQTMRDIIIEMI